MNWFTLKKTVCNRNDKISSKSEIMETEREKYIILSRYNY